MIARAAIGVALVATTAAAAPLDVGPATLALGDEWTGPAPTATLVVRSAGDVALVAVRLEVPNVTAWREATRADYIDAVARGFVVAGGVELARTVSTTGPARVPTLDLVLRRRGPGGDEVVAVRVLLFRTMTWVAMAATPRDRDRAERAARSLTPD